MKTIDQELAEVERMSGDVMEVEPKPEPTTDAQPPEDTPKDPEEPRHEQHEQITEEPKETKEEPKAPAPDPSQPKKEETKPRPERYIPLPKYQDEKKKWQEDKATLEQQLAEAQAAAEALKGAPTTKAEKAEVAADAIAEYANKHGFDIDQVQDLVQVIAASAIPPEVRQLIELQHQTAEQREAEQRFEGEWKGIESELRSMYPDATEKHMADAKKLMEQMAHTGETANVPLKYLIAGERATLDEVFERPQYTHDGARTGTSQRHISAKDFDDGVSSFDVLVNMTEDDRKQIVRDMKPSTYDKYMRYVMASDDDLDIRRDGVKI